MPSLPRAPRPSRAARAALLPAVLTVALAASACGGDETPSAAADRGGTSASATPSSPSSTPSSPPPAAPSTEGPTEGPAGEPAAEPSERVPSTLVPVPDQPLLARPARTHLLDASRMPAVADALPWTRTADGDGTQPVGVCQKASLIDIGAVRTTARHFTTDDRSASAVQVVGRFPDGKSAWRAAEVLMAWRSDCAERAAHPRVEVGEAREVPVRAGVGTVYAATYGPRSADRGRATAVGVVRKGGWLSVVEVATGEDRWPRGWNPARKAVRRIAATFRVG